MEVDQSCGENVGDEPSDAIQENGKVWVEIASSSVSFIHKPADSVGESFAAKKFPAGRPEFSRQGIPPP